MSKDKKKPDTSPADGVNTAADEAPDLDAVMRKYDRESATRLWEGTPQLIIRILMAAFGLFCIGMTLFSTAMPEIRLTMFVGCIIIIGFLTSPASKHHVRVNYLPWYDIVLMVVGAACFFYFALNAMTLVRLSTRIETVHVIIGVVGIYGEPSEIRYLAHLVEVYTEKYYQLEALIRPQYAQGALKSILLSKLLEGSAKSIAEAETLIKSRNLTLRYPVRVALLADNDGKNLTAQQAEAEFHRWESAGALSGTEDLWSLIDGRLILLLSDRPGRKAEDVQTALRLNLSLPVQAPWEIQRAYQQVLLLDSFTDSGRNLLSDPDTRLRYMLRCTAVENQDFAEEMLARLGRNFSPAEQKSLLYTAQCYYACEKSVTRAAAQLYVHKNTLLYRLAKLWSPLGVDDSGEFQQEFTVRLILEYYLGKQGPRALK